MSYKSNKNQQDLAEFSAHVSDLFMASTLPDEYFVMKVYGKLIV